MDQVRVLFLKSEYDLPSAVGRAILADNELDRKIDLLIKNALNRLADRRSMVVRYHVDAYDRTRIRLSHLAPIFNMLDFRAGETMAANSNLWALFQNISAGPENQ
jgi:hypothetical protein